MFYLDKYDNRLDASTISTIKSLGGVKARSKRAFLGFFSLRDLFLTMDDIVEVVGAPTENWYLKSLLPDKPKGWGMQGRGRHTVRALPCRIKAFMALTVHWSIRSCVCLGAVFAAPHRCGMVWCGVVWCGVVWCGVVWCAEGAVTRRQWLGCLPTGTGKREGCVCSVRAVRKCVDIGGERGVRET